MFSPYYAWSGRSDPHDHCAVNVALYGAGGRRWAMTERRREALTRDRDSLCIGPSSLAWGRDTLTVRFDETTAPRPSRLRGTVRLHAAGLNPQAFALDAAGRHRWRPVAPRARVEVSVEAAGANWSGDGYFDTNAGDEPLEDAFSAWDWSRVHRPDDTLLFYDVTRRSGDHARLALRFGPEGDLRPVESPPRLRLPLTRWRIARRVRDEPSDPPTTAWLLEDTPFYARSALTGFFGGRPARTIHESLSLDRLRSPIVKAMLPFRMPRTLW